MLFNARFQGAEKCRLRACIWRLKQVLYEHVVQRRQEDARDKIAFLDVAHQLGCHGARMETESRHTGS